MPDDRLGSRTQSTERRGRVPYVWVEDDVTGHRYDVPQSALRAGMTPVEGADLNYSSKPRRTKHFVAKDGEPSAPRAEAAVSTTPADSDSAPPVGDQPPAAGRSTAGKVKPS